MTTQYVMKTTLQFRTKFNVQLSPDCKGSNVKASYFLIKLCKISTHFSVYLYMIYGSICKFNYLTSLIFT